MDKYEFKMQHFADTGKWLSESGLEEEYEKYINQQKPVIMNKEEYHKMLSTILGCLISDEKLSRGYAKYIEIMGWSIPTIPDQ